MSRSSARGGAPVALVTMPEHKSQAPRAIQRSSRGFRFFGRTGLIFGKLPMVVIQILATTRCHTIRHLRNNPVVSCCCTPSFPTRRLHMKPVLLVGMLETGDGNFTSSTSLLRPYYDADLTYKSMLTTRAALRVPGRRKSLRNRCTWSERSSWRSPGRC